MTIDTGFKCFKCHKAITKKENGCTSGYGTDKDNNKVCFKCCGDNDSHSLAHLDFGEKMILYLTISRAGYGNYVSNWPGTLKIMIKWHTTGAHNWAGIRHDVWFMYADRYYWGVQYGENSQICHIRRVKPW